MHYGDEDHLLHARIELVVYRHDWDYEPYNQVTSIQNVHLLNFPLLKLFEDNHRKLIDKELNGKKTERWYYMVFKYKYTNFFPVFYVESVVDCSVGDFRVEQFDDETGERIGGDKLRLH
jgi:hypothetical protein